MRKLAVLANAMIIDNIGGKCPALDHYDASMRPRCCFLSREDDRSLTGPQLLPGAGPPTIVPPG